MRAGVETDLAEVLLLAGRDAEVIPHLEEALRLFEQKENKVAAARVRARLRRFQEMPFEGGR
jgi:hypothetical protein